MHQTLVERGLCLREHTDQGPLLIFPSYYRRERPELVGASGSAGELPVQRVPRRHLRHAGGPAASHESVSAGPALALRRRFQDSDRQATRREAHAAGGRRGRAGGLLRSRRFRSRRRSSSAGTFTSTCCRRRRTSNGCVTTSVRTAARRSGTAKWRCGNSWKVRRTSSASTARSAFRCGTKWKSCLPVRR